MPTGPSARGPEHRPRTPGSASRASRRASGSGSSARAGSRPGSRVGPRRTPSRPSGTGSDAPARSSSPRPRFTGRAAILVLVVALLMVSYGSSMRAYLQQRRHLSELSSSIATSQTAVDRLSREKKRWQDPAYVRTMAHQRFGWVLPGEIGFRVIGADGKPLGDADSLPAPDSVSRTNQPLWWQSAWGSVVSAGHPPTTDAKDPPSPARRIRAPRTPGASGTAR